MTTTRDDHLDGDSVDALVRAQIASGRTAGMVVAIAADDGSDATFAGGDPGPGRPALDCDSVFELGSLTKTFTATLLADMVLRGHVRLDDPVATLLPAGVRVPSRDGRQITIEDLATHRSGLPRLPTNLHPADPANPLAGYRVDELYEFLATYELTRPVDSEYEYSNVGYGLLGHALSLRAQRPLQQLVDDTIAIPLGMTTTAFAASDDMSPSFALPHRDDGVIVRIWEADTLGGAGGIVSTLHDMIAFVRANLDERGDGLGDAMAFTHVPRRPVRASMQVGLGWHIYRPFDRDVVWHSGQTAGSHSFVALDVSRRRAVVILTNSVASIDNLGFHILDPRVELADQVDVVIAPEILDSYAGIYRLGPDATLTITRTGRGLIVDASGQGTAPLEPISETEFVVRIVDAQLTFRSDEAGHPTAVLLRQHGREQEAPKVG